MLRLAVRTPAHTVRSDSRFSTVSWCMTSVLFRREVQMDISISISEYLGYGITVAVFGAVVIIGYLRNRK